MGVVHLGERENHGEGTRQIYPVTSGERGNPGYGIEGNSIVYAIGLMLLKPGLGKKSGEATVYQKHRSLQKRKLKNRG